MCNSVLTLLAPRLTDLPWIVNKNTCFRFNMTESLFAFIEILQNLASHNAVVLTDTVIHTNNAGYYFIAIVIV